MGPQIYAISPRLQNVFLFHQSGGTVPCQCPVVFVQFRMPVARKIHRQAAVRIYIKASVICGPVDERRCGGLVADASGNCPPELFQFGGICARFRQDAFEVVEPVVAVSVVPLHLVRVH